MAAASQVDIMLADKRLDDPQLLRQARRSLLKDNRLFSHFPPSLLDAQPCGRWMQKRSRFGGKIWERVTSGQLRHLAQNSRSKVQQYSGGVGAETKVASLCLQKHRYSLTHARRVLKRKKQNATQDADGAEPKAARPSHADSADLSATRPPSAGGCYASQRRQISPAAAVVDLDDDGCNLPQQGRAAMPAEVVDVDADEPMGAAAAQSIAAGGVGAADDFGPGQTRTSTDELSNLGRTIAAKPHGATTPMNTLCIVDSDEEF